MNQSKQDQGQEAKRKKDVEDAVASAGNGAPGTHDDFPAELLGQVTAAHEAEKLSVEKGIDAWKKIVAAAPAAWAPRRELARVYKKAERWNAFIEVMKEAVDKANWAVPEDKIPGPARDDRGLSRAPQARRDGGQRLQPDPEHPADELRGGRRAGRAVRDDEALARPDLAAAQEGGGGRVAGRKGRAAPARGQSVPREVLEPGRGDQVVRDDPRARSRQPGRADVSQADVREAARLGEAGRRSSDARSRRSPTSPSARPVASRSRSSPRRS